MALTFDEARERAAEHGANARHLLDVDPGCQCDRTDCVHGQARAARAHAEAAAGQLYATLANAATTALAGGTSYPGEEL